MSRSPIAVAIALTSLVLVTPAASAATVLRGDLPRRADVGFRLDERADGLFAVRLETGSAAAAGLRDGDRIVAVDGERFARPWIGSDLVRRLIGGRAATLRVERGGAERDIRFVPPPRPLEDLAGVDTVYDVLRAPDGARLRTIVTRPAGATGPLPAIFVTQWVSCDSIELVGALDGAGQTLAALAQRTGMAMIRAERTASGDSEGPGCHALDYDTEVAHYRFAFEALTRDPGIDASRVVVLGLSLGSTTAPLVAEGHAVAGVIVSGGGAETYLERMLVFDRLALERGGTPPGEIHGKMLAHARFLTRYLLDGEDPAAIAASDPRLAGVWGEMRGTADGAHYGRPYAWHRQAAARNFLGAWASIAAPVLVVYAGYDQFEAPAGHRLVVETANRLRPGSGTYVEVPQLGHDFSVYPSPEAAMAWQRGVRAPELVVEPMLAWLRGRGLAAQR
jgi:dienelactone hydrolase